MLGKLERICRDDEGTTGILIDMKNGEKRHKKSIKIRRKGTKKA
jgi:hypothetical protein